MAVLNPARVIRHVRQRLDLSQEGLARLLNATKGAVQHWERGRNNPDLGRLLALHQLCPPGAERRELDALIRQTQAQVAPLPTERRPQPLRRGTSDRRRNSPLAPGYSAESFTLMRRENLRLQNQVAKLQSALEKRSEKLRILEDLATDLQRELSRVRASLPDKSFSEATPAPTRSE